MVVLKRRRYHFSQASLDRLRAHDRELPGAREGAAPESGTDTGGEASAQGALVHAAITDVGLVRANNQDTVLEKDRVFGVCDGMGGHRGGEVASSVAAEAFCAALADLTPSPAALAGAVDAANAAVWEKAQTDESLSGMGTTLTAVWFDRQEALIAHVGDSRCYLLRGGELRQITDDHSMVMEMVRAGVITPEQAESHPMRNIITRAVGTDETVETDVIREERKAGDLWLICSDGLHGMVPDANIGGVLSALGHSPEQAVRVLKDAALAAGGRDNISAVVVWDREGCA